MEKRKGGKEQRSKEEKRERKEGKKERSEKQRKPAPILTIGETRAEEMRV